MERIKNLNRYQKGILLLLAAMIVVFGVIYGVVSSREGFLYMDEILLPGEENGNVVYSGTIRGKESRFLVTPGKEVTFQHGDRVYGPYTAREDPTAIPEDDAFSENLTGIEVKDGDEIIFRGGFLRMGEKDPCWMLIDEAGANEGLVITAVMSDGTVVDGDGNVIDVMEPSVSVILDLIYGPKLSRKGEWLAWFCGIFISVLTAATIVFADELFRLKFVFLVRDADQLEPSDWALAERYIGWTIGAIGALAIYIVGLQ